MVEGTNPAMMCLVPCHTLTIKKALVMRDDLYLPTNNAEERRAVSFTGKIVGPISVGLSAL